MPPSKPPSLPPEPCRIYSDAIFEATRVSWGTFHVTARNPNGTTVEARGSRCSWLYYPDAAEVDSLIDRELLRRAWQRAVWAAEVADAEE